MLNIYRKKISWELGLTYFEPYFSISNLPKWLRSSTKGTYDSFGKKKEKSVLAVSTGLNKGIIVPCTNNILLAPCPHFLSIAHFLDTLY